MILGANRTVSVYYLSYGGNTNTFSGTADLTGVECFIESQRAEVTAVLGVAPNIEVLVMHCDPIVVNIGDKIVDESSQEYRVAGVERHENNTDTEDLMVLTLHREHRA